MFSIFVKINSQFKEVKFRVADISDDNQMEKLYHFRYSNYLKHNYIKANEHKIDMDNYDVKSIHFFAEVDSRVIGYVRLILDEYLPTENDCFDFAEPYDMQKIPRNQRGELSRLIVEKFSETIFFPRHLIMLGLLKCVFDYAEDKKIKAGYSFIKKTLKNKLSRIKFPINYIQNFKTIYKGDVLSEYFNDKENYVVPIYYLVDEVALYLNSYFSNFLLFKKVSDNYFFRGNFLSMMIFYFSKKI